LPTKQAVRCVAPLVLAAVVACGAGSAWASDARAPDRPAARADAPDNLERLRARLAEKLGATKPPDATHPNLLRVSARLDANPAAPDGRSAARAPAGTASSTAAGTASNTAAGTASRTAAGTASTKTSDTVASAAPRKPSAALLAAVEAHRADKAGAVVPAPDAGAAGGHWAYSGVTGPAAWGGLRPEFSACANGQRQSPIDIRDGIAVELEPVQFDYRASGFAVIDNGHTVQVNVGAGNAIEVRGRRYELQQFHFHRPSEERINGRQYDMDVHLVHKDPEGRLAVVAVLLERGAAQPVVQAVWNNLPLEKGEEHRAQVALDLNHLLPADRGYYTYMGSLTTPPCDEGVLWMVMRQPVAVSQGQIDIFGRLYPMNARPVQAASGRLIKQSQ
jgi:carbonic anhydrase